jgi:hypothetical protein
MPLLLMLLLSMHACPPLRLLIMTSFDHTIDIIHPSNMISNISMMITILGIMIFGGYAPALSKSTPLHDHEAAASINVDAHHHSCFIIDGESFPLFHLSCIVCGAPSINGDRDGKQLAIQRID